MWRGVETYLETRLLIRCAEQMGDRSFTIRTSNVNAWIACLWIPKGRQQCFGIAQTFLEGLIANPLVHG